MKDYSLISEGEHHFEVQHPRDGIFQIAKKGLADDILRRIRSIPKGMAQGGVVQPQLRQGRAPAVTARTMNQPQAMARAQPAAIPRAVPAPQAQPAKPAMSMFPSAQPIQPPQGQVMASPPSAMPPTQPMGAPQGVQMQPQMQPQMAPQPYQAQFMAGGGFVGPPSDLAGPMPSNQGPFATGMDTALDLGFQAPMVGGAPAPTDADGSGAYGALFRAMGGEPLPEENAPAQISSPDLGASGKYAGLAEAGSYVSPMPVQGAANMPANPNVVPAAFTPGAGGNGFGAGAPSTGFNPYEGAYAQMAGGITGMGDAAAAAGQKTQAAYEAEQQQMAAAQADHAANLAENDTQNKDLTQAVIDNKIDPDRIWTNTTTGGKIMAAIGMMISGMGSGLTGEKNLAVEAINRTIERDVDAQKAELGKKQTLLSENLRKYGNIQTAYQATLMQMHAVTAGKVAGIAAKAQGATAKANSQYLLGQLNLQTAQLNQQVSQGQIGQQLGAGAFSNTSVNLEDPRLSPYKDRIVQLPSGGIVLAKSKDEREKVQKTLTSLDSIDSQLDGMLRLQQDQGRTVPGTTANKLAEGAQGAMVFEIKNLFDLGVLSDKEREDVEKIVPDPGSWRQDRATAQMMALKKMVANKRNSEFANHVEGYSPARAGARVLSTPQQSQVPPGIVRTGG